MNAHRRKAPVGAGAFRNELLLGSGDDFSAPDTGRNDFFQLRLKPPPYPTDMRAKGYRLELDYERIIQSDTWSLASTTEKPLVLMSLFVAWQQTPCGTLPKDDLLIAARLGIDLSNFLDHKAVLLRNWEEHSDGRLYHPVMTELVLEKIARRDRETQRKSAYRERMKSQTVPHLSHGTDCGQTRDSGGSDDTGTGTGTGVTPIPSQGGDELTTEKESTGGGAQYLSNGGNDDF